jgi:hypothetical protein
MSYLWIQQCYTCEHKTKQTHLKTQETHPETQEGVDLVDERKSEILYEDDSPHESHHCMVSSSKSIGVDDDFFLPVEFGTFVIIDNNKDSIIFGSRDTRGHE